ncbi:MAG: Stealth CR1 domain-containing protein [Bacteroidales bacterium]|nr:Stealth CR1 domain-containing protein [Bacteroidales bacterium]
MSEVKMPIDVVISWVDGEDPVHKAKRRSFSKAGELKKDDVAGAARYRSTGEIFYCIASILRFAPWVNKIFIVTDNQNPHVEEFLHRNFPDNRIPIEIVDHKVIFQGYEQYLPTFNSLAICTMLWRIPGLSDRFLYFNDDVFLTAPATGETWFEGEDTIIYADRFPARWAQFLRWCKHLGRKHKKFGHKDPMLNSAGILKSGHFYLFPHAPVPMRRDWYEKFYAEHPDILDHNIRHRFRDPSQYSAPTLFYVSAHRSGNLLVHSPKNTTLFLKPSVDKAGGYMARKLAEADSNKEMIFGCVNSLGETTIEEQQMFHQWISKLLDIEI